MHRIVVVGTSGSGKSTLARELASRLGLAHTEVDAVHWGPNWTARPEADIRRSLHAITSQQRWVIDGNYGKYRDITWARADTIVWLDYSMTLTFSRVVRRTFARWWNRDLLWGNNRETLRGQFLSRDSLFLWVINTWRKHRRDYPKLLEQMRREGKQTVRLSSQAQTSAWLDSLRVREQSQ